MTNKQQAPIGQTYHQVLADHTTNLPAVHQKAITNAVTEHAKTLERCLLLEQENEALIRDVARLTRKLHEREEIPPKRVRPRENGNGQRVR